MNLCSLHFNHVGNIKTIITDKNLLPETENCFQQKHSSKITFDAQNNSVATSRTPHPMRTTGCPATPRKLQCNTPPRPVEMLEIALARQN